MFTESQKLQLIEEVLKTDDESLLYKLEATIKKAHRSSNPGKLTAHDFVGRWTKKEATLIENAIKEGCEKI